MPDLLNIYLQTAITDHLTNIIATYKGRQLVPRAADLCRFLIICLKSSQISLSALHSRITVPTKSGYVSEVHEHEKISVED